MFARVRIGPWVLSFAVIASLLAACAGPSTTIEQTWKAPDARIGELRNVVTLYVSRDSALRRTVEDEMARRLAGSGVRATPLYAVISDSELEDREAAKAKLEAAGFDGVVALRLVSKEQQLEYIPSTWDHYWGPSWSMAYDPGYVQSELVVRVETSAYSLTNRRLVWSALSKTIDPDGVREAIDDVTQVAANEMAKQGIVPGTARPAGT